MDITKGKVIMVINIIQNLKNKMRNILKIIASISIVFYWNYFPYSYNCYSYPLVGCDSSDFWWKLPTEWQDYRGVNWGTYFFGNLVITLMIVFLYKSLLLIYNILVKLKFKDI